ncbi:expressed unknown protein [Seminavis robusta]|uniref:Uncharacterized protein n=1 Tax=Seminavis robusta TaxID=568900 RepID=A0A9N8HFV0_9STRA|nr:expressed unknown protein [Seminavis robusta]|eukprot:Sro366_g127650.1 n/a (242) ;mRNA; r:60180-60905
MDTIKQREALKDMVVGLNSQGVHFLRRGDFRNATTAFLAALQNTKILLDAAAAASSPMANQCHAERFQHPDQQQNLVPTEIPSKAACDSNDTIFAVFNQCLVFPDRASLDRVWARNEDLIPCIMLYNVGVCLQIQSLQTGSSALAERALAAYEIAMTILNGMDSVVMSSDALLLFLAVLSNAASLESQRFNTNTSTAYADLIRQVLENQEFSDLLAEPVFDFFVLYLFLTPRMCRSGAPAA